MKARLHVLLVGAICGLLCSCSLGPQTATPVEPSAIAPVPETPMVVTPAESASPSIEARPELPPEIVIPVITPLTGPWPAVGTAVKNGAEMAKDEINAAGGINGSLLKLEYFDSKLDPTEAANLARVITGDDRFPIVIGPATGSECLASLPIFEEAGMVMFTSTASPLAISESPWGFKIVPHTQIYGSLMAHLAVKELGLKKLAVLYAQDDFAFAMKTNIAAVAKSLGGEVVIEEGFTPETTDYRAILSKIKQSGAEALLVLTYAPEGASIINQAKELGLSTTMIGDGVFVDKEFFAIVGDNAEGLYAVNTVNQVGSLFDTSLLPEYVKEFYAHYQARYNEKPQMFEIPSYDVVRIVAQVIGEVGMDRKAIRDGLEQFRDMQTISDPHFSLGKSHSPLFDLQYFVVRDGNMVLFKDAPEGEYANQ